MHNIEYYSYMENIHRDYVKRELDAYVAHADWQEGCSGLYHEIRWLDSAPICDDREAAENYIGEHDRGNYDNLAVRYYKRNRVDSKAMQTLSDKTKAALEEYRKRDGVLWAETVTSTFVACKTCGSKLSRIHLKGNRCPVCRADLRPATSLKAIEAAKSKWEKAHKAKLEYIKKHGKKEVMWLVKIEYHT